MIWTAHALIFPLPTLELGVMVRVKGAGGYVYGVCAGQFVKEGMRALTRPDLQACRTEVNKDGIGDC